MDQVRNIFSTQIVVSPAFICLGIGRDEDAQINGVDSKARDG